MPALSLDQLSLSSTVETSADITGPARPVSGRGERACPRRSHVPNPGAKLGRCRSGGAHWLENPTEGVGVITPCAS